MPVEATANPTTTKKPTLGEAIFGHAILIVGCVLFPAFVTAVVPLSVTTFTRTGEAIRADVSKRLLFVVPYRHITVSPVQSVNDLHSVGSKSESAPRRPGAASSSSTVSEDQSFLLIQAESSSAKVEVSPVNIRGALEKTRTFFEDPSQTRLRLITVANWKFGVIGGGLLSLLTLFYLYIVIGSLLGKLRRRLRSPAETPQ